MVLVHQHLRQRWLPEENDANRYVVGSMTGLNLIVMAPSMYILATIRKGVSASNWVPNSEDEFGFYFGCTGQGLTYLMENTNSKLIKVEKKTCSLII